MKKVAFVSLLLLVSFIASAQISPPSGGGGGASACTGLSDSSIGCSATFATNSQTATYQALAADFTNLKTITVPSGTFTITLVASGSQPAAGKYIDIVNYGSGVITISRSGQNINGGTSSITLAAASATAPTHTRIISDGTNYFADLSGSSGGVATAGTYYLTSSGNSFGPVFPATIPSTVTYAWRNQGTASETAIGNALYLLAVAASGDSIKGREVTIAGGSTPISFTAMMLPQVGTVSFASSGIYFADNGSGKITTFVIANNTSTGGGSNRLQVSHYTNATTFSAAVLDLAMPYNSGPVVLKIQDTGTNHVFSFSTNGGQTFIQVFSESRTAFLTTTDRAGYMVNSNNATYAAGTTLLSWVQGF